AKFSRGWLERFKRRHKLVERVRTQLAQKVPEDTPLIVKNFLQTSRIHEVPIKTTGNDKLHFTVVLGYTASGDKLLPAIIFKLKKTPKTDLMISTYISRVIRARSNGFFKNKGIIFVDRHSSHIHDDV
ncbi:6828_t:CDS:2, partial [Ambispora leptoticha]